MSGPFDAFLSRAASDCVNARHYPDPDRLHDGPCDTDGGYVRGGTTVLCSLCLAAIREDKYKPGGGER